MRSRYATLSREQLARLVPELLLVGQLIDRSGMAWCISAFGREEMARIAIEEWAASSPVYTRRMQRALGYEGDDVVAIFKGLQLDIGAPPQFMDFRYTVHDRWSGEFHLDHCGALMDVEPMGPDYVRSMCHDIEDPTFDATAVATNARAQVRPLHRPPRTPADRRPHCAWTVRIDPAHEEVQPVSGLATVAASEAARLELASIDPASPGWSGYTGPLLDDLDFSQFSHAALVRIADEVCLQMHLLVISFHLALRARTGDDAAGLAQHREISTKQLVGIAGVAADRLRRALGLPADAAGALRVLELHPLLNPAAYVTASLDADALVVRPGAAQRDGAWIALCGPGATRALKAVVHAVEPHLDVEVAAVDDRAWSLRVVVRDAPLPMAEEVAVTRFSSGAEFVLEPRHSLPITPVASGIRRS